MCSNNPKCENRAGTCRCAPKKPAVVWEVGKKYVDREGRVYELVVDVRGRVEESSNMPLGFISEQNGRRGWQFRDAQGRYGIPDTTCDVDVIGPYVEKKKIKVRTILVSYFDGKERTYRTQVIDDYTQYGAKGWFATDPTQWHGYRDLRVESDVTVEYEVPIS